LEKEIGAIRKFTAMSETDKHELQEEPAGGGTPIDTTENQSGTEPDKNRGEGPDKAGGHPGEVPDKSPATPDDSDHSASPARPSGTDAPEAPHHPVASGPGEGPGKRSQKALVPETPGSTDPSTDPAGNESPPEKEPARGASVDGEAQGPDTPAQKEEAPTAGESADVPQKTPKGEAPPEETEENADEAQTSDSGEDIDSSLAEDAEDTHNERRHEIPFPDYHSLTMENLVGELQRLLRTEKVQAIRRHVEAIRHEFDHKFSDFISEKKEEFINRGGLESDFSYNSVTKRQFNELYGEYREKRDQYYKNLEKQLKDNLEERLGIIEDLKGLVSVEEDMTSTYKSFKELQERWKKAGPIPRAHYNDVWRTYQHHLEIFYDFLSLNRELRDLDFKHNLEEKEKLSLRAEALLEEPDVNKAFRELQILHKIWKEDIGPVGKEHREAIWERFSEATRKMHERRQAHFQELDRRLQQNLEEKQKIIGRIAEISTVVAENHKGIQKQIREVEGLRDQFFKAGRVPQKENEATWAAFKAAVRQFNRSKNAFYKNLKNEQQKNLDLKKALLNRALELKDLDDWEAVTPEMKKIQREWKEIGHVPRKYSDAIWKEFKAACNHYFDRLHKSKNSAFAEEKKNLELKNAILEEVRGFQLGDQREKDIKAIQGFIGKWNGVGHVPRDKKHINSKFHKILDALFRKLGVGKQEAEILMYGNRIADLSEEEDTRAIERERQFVRKKIEELKAEIRQLENNMNFFSEPSEDNPMVKEVLENIERKKRGLETWKAKLKKLNILRNSLKSEAGAQESQEGDDPENEN
jgi:hypothetical protein